MTTSLTEMAPTLNETVLEQHMNGTRAEVLSPYTWFGMSHFHVMGKVFKPHCKGMSVKLQSGQSGVTVVLMSSPPTKN